MDESTSSHTNFCVVTGDCKGHKLCQIKSSRVPFLQGLLGEFGGSVSLYPFASLLVIFSRLI